MNQGFVYRIVNAQNGKMYIGKTVRTLRARWRQHLTDSRQSPAPLYAAMRKHGRQFFQIEELASIETGDKKLTNRLLNHLEINLIREFGTFVGEGYNATPGGEGMDKGTRLNLAEEQRKKKAERIKTNPISGSGPLNGMFGRKHRPETIEKLKAFRRRTGPKAEETRRRMSEVRKGKPTWASTHREIVAEQTRARKLGVPRTEEEKRKISEARIGRFTGANNPYFGRKHSEEIRGKMRKPHLSNRGENHPMWGKHHTEETKAKIAATKLARRIATSL